MGSGKSTLGRQLSKEWHREFIDLDNYIEEMYNLSIPSIFNQYGEKEFRNRETKALQQVLSRDNNCIISLGGGTPCHNLNIDLIKEKTHSIYLKLSPKELATRLIRSKNPRPLVIDKSPEELLEFIKSELKRREEFYNQANQLIESDCIQISDLIAFISL